MTNVHKLFWDLPVQLQDQIASVTTGNPTALDTFTQVCDFYRTQAGSAVTQDAPGSPKKRKTTSSTNEDSNDDNNDDDDGFNADSALIINSLSVSLPVRKKLDLALTPTQLVARAPNSSTTAAPEFVLDYRHDRVEAAFLLEVPEKTKPQWNLIVAFTRQGAPASSFDYFQATLLEDTIKNVVKPVAGEQYLGSIKEMVILYFQRRNIPIISHETVSPSASLFQAPAHRGSKDGLLYFLPGYIFFGFKKPLVLFRLENILAISYSSITRSMFNMIIKYIDPAAPGDAEEEAEIEFSIIDQIHYDRINRFVTENQLHNDSMAENRRAKIDNKAQFPTELGRAHAEQQAVSATATGGTQGLAILDNDFDGSDEEDEDFNSDTKEDNSDSDNDSEDDEDDEDDDDEEL
ncbi:similar to Saccharomyces cerevisiae YNL206C RTT106 Histone chaperone, involved in regulation of chromatin structure in both transcribed and silenced chromosomal regions [Geotrichum candidum]|uniref:Histone chaperone RTT106 n=1 Tax=Geotrichum candidum TaxID=1173061 RepID=A0A0J9XKK9_GEOCN|nr:similar to Saccharomyces cerevisiae YNL206C RTT106 Histone chaperone, involved in regulation of chromatin structure in both transcribed and silenced chromosomal regions [Geotrichum candidum]